MIILLILTLSIFNIFKPSLPTKLFNNTDDIKRIAKIYNDMGHPIHIYNGIWIDPKTETKPIIVMYFEHKGSGPAVAAGLIKADNGINILLISLPDEIKIIK